MKFVTSTITLIVTSNLSIYFKRMMKFKRPFYIFCFMVLVAMLGFLFEAAFRFLYLRLLVSDFKSYSFGLNAHEWVIIDLSFRYVCMLIGAAIGYRYGVYWWRKLYIESYHRW